MVGEITVRVVKRNHDGTRRQWNLRRNGIEHLLRRYNMRVLCQEPHVFGEYRRSRAQQGGTEMRAVVWLIDAVVGQNGQHPAPVPVEPFEHRHKVREWHAVHRRDERSPDHCVASCNCRTSCRLLTNLRTIFGTSTSPGSGSESD